MHRFGVILKTQKSPFFIRFLKINVFPGKRFVGKPQIRVNRPEKHKGTKN